MLRPGNAGSNTAADHVERDFTAPAPDASSSGTSPTSAPGKAGCSWPPGSTAHSKAIIGWSMAEHLRAHPACDAITRAARKVDLAGGAIVHCERGGQYTSAQLRSHWKGYGISSARGSSGVCWDDAMAASCVAALKNALVYRTVFPTWARTRTAIAEYVEVFYNRQPIHSGLGTGLHRKSPTRTSKTPQAQHRTANVAVR